MTMTAERLAELDAVMAKETHSQNDFDERGIDAFSAYHDLRAHIAAQAATIAAITAERDALLRMSGIPEPHTLATWRDMHARMNTPEAQSAWDRLGTPEGRAEWDKLTEPFPTANHSAPVD